MERGRKERTSRDTQTRRAESELRVCKNDQMRGGRRDGRMFGTEGEITGCRNNAEQVFKWV